MDLDAAKGTWTAENLYAKIEGFDTTKHEHPPLLRTFTVTADPSLSGESMFRVVRETIEDFTGFENFDPDDWVSFDIVEIPIRVNIN